MRLADGASNFLNGSTAASPECPSLCKCGAPNATSLHRHLRTLLSTSRRTAIGGSRVMSISSPSSVVNVMPSGVCHPIRNADAYIAAAGPRTTLHGLFACRTSRRALAKDFTRMPRGTHSCQMASAQCPMGSVEALYAGSSLWLSLSSDSIRDMFTSLPRVAGIAAAATTLLLSLRTDGATPITKSPNRNAAVPPVRKIRATLTPLRSNATNLPRRRLKALNREACT